MKAKILYIEDNDQSLYMVTFLLNSEGYEVLQARDGIEGIEAAGRSSRTLSCSTSNCPAWTAMRLRGDFGITPIWKRHPLWH